MCDNVLQIPEIFPEEELDKLVEKEYPEHAKYRPLNIYDLQRAYRI